MRTFLEYKVCSLSSGDFVDQLVSLDLLKLHSNVSYNFLRVTIMSHLFGYSISVVDTLFERTMFIVSRRNFSRKKLFTCFYGWKTSGKFYQPSRKPEKLRLGELPTIHSYIPLRYAWLAACRPAAELASFWNKPIISWVASDPEFGDKSIYTTLGRTLGSFEKMALFLVEVFRMYSWRRLVVVSSNYFFWLDAGKAVRKVRGLQINNNLLKHIFRGGSRGGAIRPWPPSKLAMEFGPHPLEEEIIMRVV